MQFPKMRGLILHLMACLSTWSSSPSLSLPSRARQNSKRLLIHEAPSMEAYSAKPDRRGNAIQQQINYNDN
jgi:hypothetical protein